MGFLPRHNQAVSESEEMERAVAEAAAVVRGGTSGDPGEAVRLAQAGAAAVEALRHFDAHPVSTRPGAGAVDPHRDERHDIRAAAQTVLAQLELIGLAWPSWNAGSRQTVLQELADASRELEELVRRSTASPPMTG